jgi:hypothetical protein
MSSLRWSARAAPLEVQLRRHGERIGSVHGWLELLAPRGRVSKTWLLGEIGWAIVPPPTRAREKSALWGAGRWRELRAGWTGRSPPEFRTLAGAWRSGNGPATSAGHNPKGRSR